MVTNRPRGALKSVDYKVLAGISPKAKERNKIAKTLSMIDFCKKLAVTGGNVSYGSRSYNDESDIYH